MVLLKSGLPNKVGWRSKTSSLNLSRYANKDSSRRLKWSDLVTIFHRHSKLLHRWTRKNTWTATTLLSLLHRDLLRKLLRLFRSKRSIIDPFTLHSPLKLTRWGKKKSITEQITTVEHLKVVLPQKTPLRMSSKKTALLNASLNRIYLPTKLLPPRLINRSSSNFFE